MALDESIEFRGRKWLFKDRLKDRMKQLGIKHDTEVYGPQSIDIDQRTFSNYKTGKRIPSCDVIFKLAVRLKCTSDYLLGLEDEPTHEGTDVAEYTGLSGETIEQLHQLSLHNDKDDESFRMGLDFIEFMMRDDEFQIHPTFNPKEETVGTIIKEAIDSCNTYYRKRRSAKKKNYGGKLDQARTLLRNYGIKALYREEMLEYYQQLLSKRMSKITDEWLKNLFKEAEKYWETHEEQGAEETSTAEINRAGEDSAIFDETVFEDTYSIVPNELLEKMNSIGKEK